MFKKISGSQFVALAHQAGAIIVDDSPLLGDWSIDGDDSSGYTFEASYESEGDLFETEIYFKGDDEVHVGSDGFVVFNNANLKEPFIVKLYELTLLQPGGDLDE